MYIHALTCTCTFTFGRTKAEIFEYDVVIHATSITHSPCKGCYTSSTHAPTHGTDVIEFPSWRRAQNDSNTQRVDALFLKIEKESPFSKTYGYEWMRPNHYSVVHAGAAGVFGALAYAGFTSAGVSPRNTVLIMNVIPFTLGIR